jgi:hypothetical protein
MEITYAGYTFRFQVVTTSNRYEPDQIQHIETPTSLVARTRQYSFGDGAGSVGECEFEARFNQSHGELTWEVTARHAEPIKGVRVEIDPLPGGPVLLPFAEVELQEGEPGRCFIYPGGYYPVRHVSSTGTQPGSGPVHDWAAPFAVFDPDGAGVILSAPEYPPRVKKIWLYRQAGRTSVHLYDEANASQRETRYCSATWSIRTGADWRDFTAGYTAWISRAFGIQPFEERPEVQPWLKEIGLVAILHGLTHDGKICHTFEDMAARLPELARRFPARRTLIKLVGFEGRIDRHWPDTSPSPILGGQAGFGALVKEGHRLGFRFMPHLNVWGASFENPRTQAFLADQIIDPEGRPSTWSYDQDQDEIAEEIMAYISPASPAWQKRMVENIAGLVKRGMDAIYLDQTGTCINDLRHDPFQGLCDLYRELRAAFPTLQMAGEAPNHEITTSLVGLVCGISTVPSPRLAELYRLLFGPYIRQYGYNLPPEPYRGVWGPPAHIEKSWSRERFLQYEERSQRVGGIPTLNLTDRRISLDGELVELVLERARNFTI